MQKVYILCPQQQNGRVQLGISYIRQTLAELGYEPEELQERPGEDYRALDGVKICVGVRESSAYIVWLEESGRLLYHAGEPKPEGFYLARIAPDMLVVAGADATGALYGALELRARLLREKRVPEVLAFCDYPRYKLRGPVVGLQKTKVEPPRLTYEYPITPERFPWFYDRSLWLDYLDMLVENRCNVLYIWTGQPFSSLVKLDAYPEALEVTEEVFRKNQEMFSWLTAEADRRGIWVVLKFYSVHIPLPFAQAHGLELLQNSIHPLAADYTYQSIVAFIKSFPHIGLMVCLGEALRGDQNKEDWFLKVVVPAVKEGVREAGISENPPLILRGHDCKAEDIMHKAVKEYDNLYTMWKFNGESLTSYYPTGNWQRKHRGMTAHGQTHIMNVHVLANLEPFRYAAPGFIQKCMQAGEHRLGTNGLHLYPLFFWDWPWSADRAQPRLRQMDRDWMWYQAWMRYAWNPDLDETAEEAYWKEQLARFFGCGMDAAGHILRALSGIGECMPRILRRIGITEGNRQTLALGMTMSQLTNVNKYRPNTELWKSVSTPGEQLGEYVQKELAGERHYGETPPEMAADVQRFAAEALEQIRCVRAEIGRNREEYERYVTDIEALQLICENYACKLMAAERILRYRYTMDAALKGDLQLLDEAREWMRQGLDAYRRLAALTEETYLYANSMQTPQRKIPFPNGETYGHWKQCLPCYEEEYRCFERNLAAMHGGIFPEEKADEHEGERLPEAAFRVLSPNAETYRIERGATVFTDCNMQIQKVIGELSGLTGVRFGLGEAIEKGVKLSLEFEEDSLLLVGYMGAKAVEWLQVPDLETNTHADDRGGLAVVYGASVYAEGCPLVDIHAFRYEKGKHEIYLGTGGFMIAGVIPASAQLKPRNAGMSENSLDKLDWLYEETL